jgi:hypothetical protein
MPVPLTLAVEMETTLQDDKETWPESDGYGINLGGMTARLIRMPAVDCRRPRVRGSFQTAHVILRGGAITRRASAREML